MKFNFHNKFKKIISLLIVLTFVLIPASPLLAAPAGLSPSQNALVSQEVQVGTGTSDFVARLYLLFLGRAADQEGLDYWTSALQTGQISGTDAAYRFVFSSEFENRAVSDSDFVRIMYEALLGRGSDLGGENYWLSALFNGMSRYSVLAGFANSPEFRSICQSYGVNPGYLSVTQPADLNPRFTALVTRFYKVCLNRMPDQAGLNNWVLELQIGRITIADLAYNLIFSTEYLNHNYSNAEFVTNMYEALLGRGPDAQGYTYWLNSLNTVGSRYSLFLSLVNSSEFHSLWQVISTNYGYVDLIGVNTIDITGATTVDHGQTLQLGAVIAPSNASNQTIDWSVTTLAGGTATIDTSGLLSATGVGTVTVTATNAVSGVTGTKVVTITLTPAEIAIAAINNAVNPAEMSVAITAYTTTIGLVLSNYNALPDGSKVIVQTAMLTPTFTTLVQIKSTFDSEVLKQTALVAVNSAPDAAAMGVVITTYASALSLAPASLTDYNALSTPSKDIVRAALVGQAFPTAAAVNTAFVVAVSVPTINQITVSATMESALIRYSSLFGFDSTAYTTYTFPTSVNPNAPSFKSRVNTTMIAGTFASASAVKDAFDASVMAEAVRVIDIQLFNFMVRDLRTFSVILGLNLTNFDTLINKGPTLTAMVAEPFATKAHIQEYFDMLVLNQQTLEAVPMLDAFNNAPNAATMENVLAIYSTIFNTADYNTYNNSIGLVEKGKIQTTMLTPTYTSQTDIQTAFVIGIMNNQYINSGKLVFANNIVLLGLATSTGSDEYSLLPSTEKTLITNAIFAGKPIADKTEVVVAALNSAVSESYIGTLLTLNYGILGLDLTAYSAMSPADKTTVNQWLIAATMNNAADVQTAFAAAMVSLSITNTLAVGGATSVETFIAPSQFTYTLTTGTFDAAGGIAPANWILGGTFVGDFGTITNIVLSNGNTKAIVYISGTLYTSASTGDYTAEPVQAAFSIGSIAPAAVPVVVLMQAEGAAAATTGTTTITYNLVTGIFDPTQGIVTANWILGGVDAVDLGNVTNVVLSNGDTTATLTVSGTVGANTKVYTVAPDQAIFTPAAFAAPLAAAVVVTP